MILAMNVPQVIYFTIPVSILVSVLLVFGRFSADSEITAMQACGISLLRIASPVWLFSIMMSFTCLYISNRAVPLAHYKTRHMVKELKKVSIGKLIEEGRTVECTPELSVFVGKKNQTNFENIRIYDTRSGFRREITAKTGELLNNQENGKITIKLYDVRIDPFKKGTAGTAYCDVLPVSFEGMKKSGEYHAKRSDFTDSEIFEKLNLIKQKYPDELPQKIAVEKSQLLVELSGRAALSFACFVFALIGVPLGVKSHRKETSVGIAISLALILVFYLLTGASDSLAKEPQLHPYLIAWIPSVISIIDAIWMLRKKN
jgi:lipopolysaccharide export system permease protein